MHPGLAVSITSALSFGLILCVVIAVWFIPSVHRMHHSSDFIKTATVFLLVGVIVSSVFAIELSLKLRKKGKSEEE